MSIKNRIEDYPVPKRIVKIQPGDKLCTYMEFQLQKGTHLQDNDKYIKINNPYKPIQK